MGLKHLVWLFAGSAALAGAVAAAGWWQKGSVATSRAVPSAAPSVLTHAFRPKATMAVPLSSSPSPARLAPVLAVPFVVQAPGGQWDDPVFQDGCEEAAVLMAELWLAGEGVPSDAAAAVRAVAEQAQVLLGTYHDASAADTARLLRAVSPAVQVTVRPVAAATDLTYELARGHLLLVPVNGRALGNPFFRPPGPERHLLVIRGYDPAADEFVTNDPGTRRGEGLRYGAERLLAALRDYDTGYHAPVHPERRVMIVVARP